MSTNAANNEKILSNTSCMIIDKALTIQYEEDSNAIEELLYKAPLRTGTRPSKSDWEQIRRLSKDMHRIETAGTELEASCENFIL